MRDFLLKTREKRVIFTRLRDFVFFFVFVFFLCVFFFFVF